MILEARLRFGAQCDIARIAEQLCPASEKARQRLRADPGFALKHLDEGILDRKADNRVSFIAQHLGDRLQDTAFTGPCDALDRDRPIL